MASGAMKGLVIRLSVAGASLYPMLACALGLSEIQLDSRLNQPLRARIEVLDVSEDEWSRVHTKLNWQSSADAAPIHPDQLEALTVRTIEDANHRHFIEIRSTAAIIEPLFDLPIEVAGPTAHIIRNYSVLLDPPAPAEDVPGQVGGNAHISGTALAGTAHIEGAWQNSHAVQLPGAAQTSEAAQLAAASPAANIAQAHSSPNAADTQEGPKAQLANSNTHRHSRHRHSGSRLSSSGAVTQSAAPRTQAPRTQAHQGQVPQPQAAQSQTRENSAFEAQAPRNQVRQNPASDNQTSQSQTSASERQALQQQLETLQQTLASMQATIAAQNAQIADLTARIAARGQSQAAHSSPVAAPAAQAAETEASPAGDSGVAESDDAGSDHKSNHYFWGAALGLIAGLTAALTALFLRKRAATNTNTDPEMTATVRALIEKQTSGFDTAHQEPKFDTAIMWARTKTTPDTTTEPNAEDEPPIVVKAQADTGKFPSVTLDDMTQAYFAALPQTTYDGTSEIAADEDTQLAEVDAAALLELDAEMCHAAEMAAQGMDTTTTATLPSVETAVLPNAETAILPGAETAVLAQADTATLSNAETAILDELGQSLEDDAEDEETARFIKKVAI